MSKMVTLTGNFKQVNWATAIRSKTMANLDAMAAQFNDKGKEAVTIAQEDLLTHTDSSWWIDHCSEFTTPDGIFCNLSEIAQAAISALKQ
jgi:hypothetical protein